MVVLREYQIKGIREIFEAWNPDIGNMRNVLFQMPTGTGKTTVFSEIVRKAQLKEKKILIVVHRLELVEQIIDRLANFGVVAGVISAGKTPQSNLAIQVATIQTLSRRESPEADIVIVDECHHAKAQTYKALWEIYPSARFLGVTATPVRMNGDGFEDLFDTLIVLGKLSFFIREGFLTKMRHMVCYTPDLSKVKLRMREYDLHQLKNVMLANSVMANLVKSYQRHALGKKMIVFAVDVEHSKTIVKRYQEFSISAAHLDSTTPRPERKKLLEQFRSGEIKVLCNVDIVSEGFDVPDCEVVQLARPTKSLALYLQQVGRCMRPTTGKEFGMVLDNAGLWLEHGLSYVDREWSLKGLPKKKKEFEMKPHVGMDRNGNVREINEPREADNIELIEYSPEVERLLIFEDLLRFVKRNKHKLASVVYKYCDYLIEQGVNLTDIEIKYCHRRLNAEGANYKKGFWYYKRKEISERQKEENR